MVKPFIDLTDPPDTGTDPRRVVVLTAAEVGHDRAVSLSARLAERLNIPVTLTSISPIADVAVSKTGLAAAADALEHARPGITVAHSVVVAENTSVEAFAAYLQPDDLAVVTIDPGAAGSKEFAHALAHRWGGPVLMLGPKVSSDVPFAGVVAVALDGSALAERSLPFAVGLAERLNAPTRLVQVVDSALVDQVARLADRGERVSESAYISDVAVRLAFETEASWTIVHNDDPAAGLRSFLDEHTVGFLVMSTHGATGIPRPALGSVCMETVADSEVPVVVHRPTGIVGELPRG